MPLHKLNQATNTSYQLKKKKLCTFPNISFFPFLFKVNKRPLPPPSPVYKPQICACTRTQTHTLVHKLLTLEHSDTQMSLWLV